MNGIVAFILALAIIAIVLIAVWKFFPKQFTGLNEKIVAPVFFFLGGVLGYVTVLAVISSVAGEPVYVVVACALFVLAYNAFRFGMKMAGMVKR